MWVYLFAIQLVPGPIQTASNHSPSPPYCSNHATFWMFVFAVLAVGNFIFQEYYFLRERWRLPRVDLSNGNWLAIFIAALGIALAFFSFVQMLPYWINALVYIFAFAAMIVAAKAATIRWTDFGYAFSWLGAMIYVAFFGYATIVQYQHQHEIALVFKTSVSEYRKFITTNDLAEFRDYLHSLDVPVPDSGPAIGIDSLGNCSSTANPRSNKNIRTQEIFIGDKCLTRKQMTLQYSAFIVERLPNSKGLDADINHRISFIAAQSSFATYLNSSFWGEEDDPFCTGSVGLGMFGSPLLWKIRERVGSKFTDRMVAYAVRLAADDPMAGMDSDSRIYIARKLKDGDSVVDDGTNWPLILEILTQDGVNIQQI